LFIASLRNSTDNSSSGWWTVFSAPAQLTFENYGNLLGNSQFMGSFVNTIAITVPTTLLVIIIGALAGYAFAWIQFPGRDWLLIAIIVLLAVPVQVALIPIAKLFGSIGLFGSIVGVIIFHTSFGLPFAIFLLRNFFTQVPGELMEAARLDGASEWRIFSRIILPLGMPAIASLGIFQFLWVWNDLLVALIFTNASSQPVTVAIQSQLRQFGANIDVLSSGAFLSMVIPLIVFFAFQRYFVTALLAGSQR
jgi:alpha-glucoside transport system permease protein